MVMYGSDYLLGLSTMAPDLFALRDKYVLEGNAEFFHVNDWLQYLGNFAFRAPVPAYKHTAAQWLKLRGWIATSKTHPKSAARPESDIEILKTLWADVAKYSSSGRESGSRCGHETCLVNPLRSGVAAAQLCSATGHVRGTRWTTAHARPQRVSNVDQP